ncbi:cocaine- and amphetamine-regulated transcript protein-like [Ambystoma mexicanum]|uniref:cocaine- and amphetamine-regulated transcript protein-like n=1 Tax=Ambystoma mexicanum TaxID=8296 RepID=UPI0037E74443
MRGRSTHSHRPLCRSDPADAPLSVQGLNRHPAPEMDQRRAGGLGASSRGLSALLLGLCLSLLLLGCQAQGSEEGASPEDLAPQHNYSARTLVDALEELLENNQDNRLSVEKKASQLPRCDVGERCALKHGPRIGKLCDCLRGASCNTFLLRCY